MHNRNNGACVNTAEICLNFEKCIGFFSKTLIFALIFAIYSVCLQIIVVAKVIYAQTTLFFYLICYFEK